MKTTTVPTEQVAGNGVQRSLLHKIIACLLAFVLVTTYAGVPAYALADAQEDQIQSEQVNIEGSSEVSQPAKAGAASAESANGVANGSDDSASSDAANSSNDSASSNKASNAEECANAAVPSESSAATQDASLVAGEAETSLLAEDAVALLSDPASEETVSAKCTIVGVDVNGNEETWVSHQSYTLPKGSTAADLSELAFAQAGLDADYGIGAWGWYLNTITSPNNPNVTLGYDATTGKSWQLFVDGVASDYGAGSVVLADDGSTEIIWYYSGSGSSLSQTTATCTVVGVDESGNEEIWASSQSYTLPKGSTAVDLSELAFAETGLDADYGIGAWGWYLNTITSPNNPNVTLGYDATTGKSWQLFVDGVASDYGAGSVVLADDGSSNILWFYSGYGDSAVDISGSIIVNPNAEAPDWNSDWSGYGNSENGGTVTGVNTPVDEAELSWAVDFSDYASSWGTASEVIVSNGYAFFALDNAFLKVNTSTGLVEKTANLANTISYTSRPIFSQGLILVPLDGGAVQAITADSLSTKWISSSVSSTTQSSCTLSLSEGSVIVSTVEGANWTEGCICAISLETGETLWVYNNSSDYYYWNGGVLLGQQYVTSTSGGTVEVISAVTGEKSNSLSLGSRINSDLLVDEDGLIYAVTRDGVLHVLSLGEQLTEIKTISLGVSDSVCTPTIADNMLVVGSHNGLVLVNLDSSEVAIISALSDGTKLGDVRSTPLVSKQSGKIVVYFNQNAFDGSVYQYVVGEESASVLWKATGDYVQYCDSPIAVDKNGTLYHIVDYTALIALVQSDSSDDSGNESGDNSGSNSDNNQSGNSNSNSSSAQQTSGSSGKVAASSSPIADDGADDDKSEKKDEAQDEKSSSDESTSSKSVVTSNEQKEGFNVLPVIGIVAGVVLLAGAGWFLFAGRKKDDEDE